MLKTKYDIVVSLGGNCAPAMHMRRDGQRRVSLPFDWLYMKDDRPIRWLAEGVARDFCDFALRENLERILPGNPEYTDEDPDKVKYVDRHTGYRLIHHFLRPVEDDAEYARFSGILGKRMNRLFNLMGNAETVLLVLNVSFPVADDLLIAVQKAFAMRFPETHFDMQVLWYRGGAPFEDRNPTENVHVRSINREENVYDFNRTSIEWDFLDKVEISDRLFGRSEASVRPFSRRIVAKMKAAIRWMMPHGLVIWHDRRKGGVK